MQLYWQNLSCGCREKENHTAVFSYQKHLTILGSLQIMFFIVSLLLRSANDKVLTDILKLFLGLVKTLDAVSTKQACTMHSVSCVNFLFYKLWPEVGNMVQTESGSLSHHAGHVTLPSHVWTTRSQTVYDATHVS